MTISKIIPDRNPLTPMTGPPDIDFWRLDKRLRSTEMKIVYVGIPDPDYKTDEYPDGGARRWWDLAGALAGRQALTLAPQLKGTMHLPFQQVLTEGAYQIGSTYERTNYLKREIGLGVQVSTSMEPDTSFRYRMLEQRWWASWSEKEDGYLGCFTRTHGWRWLRVRLAEEPKTAFELDPTAFENNFMQWDMTIVATSPFWCKRIETSSWANLEETSTPLNELLPTLISRLGGGEMTGRPVDDILVAIGKILNGDIEGVAEGIIKQVTNFGAELLGLVPPNKRMPKTTLRDEPLTARLADMLLVPGVDVGEATLKIPNRGTWESWPKYLVSTPGYVWIQDGIGGDMVMLPLLHTTDGDVVMIDTDPLNRTLTGAKDPVDPLFYRILRNSQLIDFLLSDIVDSTEPLQRRMGGKGFQNPIPKRTLASLKVRHSDPNGTITAYMPQRFRMAYG